MIVDALTSHAINVPPWDYSDRAATYEHRADYASTAVKRLLSHLPDTRAARVVDIGAGTGKLTRPLLAAGFDVVAVEPNENMRAIATQIPLNDGAKWMGGRAEQLPLKSHLFDLACFGSSFNVVDPERALDEVSRVLKSGGLLAMMWNHRDLNDPLQAEVETVISAHLPHFSHGSRREDPSAVVLGCRQFAAVEAFRHSFEFVTTHEHYIAAWRSHATLARAAGARFEAVIEAIAKLVPHGEISVPFSTAVWVFGKNVA